MAGYGTDDGFDAWLTENGFTLPAGAPDNAVLLQRGSTYIDGTYGNYSGGVGALRFTGYPTGGVTQERAWPRAGAYAFCDAIADDLIPDAVIKASYFAAYADAVTPGSLSVTYTPGTSKVLTEVKGIKWTVVGDASAEASMVLRLSVVEGLLAPYLVHANMPSAMIV